MRQVDYMIVGQGLAGSLLACLLEIQRKNVLVIDNAHRTAASLAAAGIMNPITGKRLNRPFLVDQLLQNFDFEVIHQTAGVRPVVKVDNRPIVGAHPLQSRVAVLNGLGSKGVLQAPFAALQLMAYLEAREPIHPDFDVCRRSLWE